MDFINKWKDKIAHSIGDKIQSVKLDFIGKASGIMGYLFFGLIGVFCMLVVILFLGFGLAEVFVDVFNSRAGGYFATAGVFALMITLSLLFRKVFITFFSGVFIRILTRQEDDNDDEDEKDN